MNMNGFIRTKTLHGCEYVNSMRDIDLNLNNFVINGSQAPIS